MHSDAQFAGSSSVPAHVEMMGLIGAGNNPMVGMTGLARKKIMGHEIVDVTDKHYTHLELDKFLMSEIQKIEYVIKVNVCFLQFKKFLGSPAGIYVD